jgi:hypothetical protein
MKKHILSVCLIMLFGLQWAIAKDYAYIYIEGDKQTPFYVKLEGQMMPRLGKNYCILSNMDAGISNIEILFQQNQFPPQDFVIKVPEGGSRGFLLKKVNDHQWALYDMQQGFYIMSGNTINDDRLVPAATPNESSVVTNPVAQTQPPVASESLPAFVAPAKSKGKKAAVVAAAAATDAAVTNSTSDKKFINGIELNSDGSVPAAAVAAVPVAAVTTKKIKKGRTIKADTASLAAAQADEFEEVKKREAAANAALVAPGIPNSDCKTPMSNEAFEDFATKILDQTDDDDKLKVLIKNKDRNCFTTEQVRIIANNFETQSGRYEVTRVLFSRTSDQDNYPKLEALFKTNYLKDKFKEIMNPK